MTYNAGTFHVQTHTATHHDTTTRSGSFPNLAICLVVLPMSPQEGKYEFKVTQRN